MALTSGTRLGPYEIVALIGAGGMGEVYKARDTRLDRIVALKVSLTQFSARFEREARVIAQLNHPHICQLYDVGPNYLVMEFVEGDPLKGPLPEGKALEYAGQILEALDAAHRKSITHRDLKPLNILVTKQGIKLLDFGLASIVPGPEDPTLPQLTQVGAVMGTPAYMSPEQREGKNADARSDIYSFGCVLHEMLTGQRACQGRTQHDSVAIERVIKVCLEQDPDARWQTAREVKVGLEWVAGDLKARPNFAWRRARLLWIAGAAALASAAFAIAWTQWPRSEVVLSMPELILSISPKAGSLAPVGEDRGTPEISPDGSAILFYGPSGVQLRRLNSLEQEPVRANSTGGGQGRVGSPGFWSPDSKRFVFEEGDSLKRMSPPDGATELVATGLSGSLIGGSVSDKGTIIFSAVTKSIGLYLVSASGGGIKPLMVDGLAKHSLILPQFLPGDEDFLFVDAFDSKGLGIYLAKLRDEKATEPVLLMNNETAVRYTPAGGGQVLFVRNDNLYAQRLDLAARKLAGEPKLLQRGVASSPASFQAHFSVSRDGIVVWRQGSAGLSQVTILDRRGKALGIAGPPSLVHTLRLASDEKHLLLVNHGIAWLLEPYHAGLLRVAQGHGTIFSSDGSKFYEVVFGPNGGRLSERQADGSRAARELETPSGLARAFDASPDGKTILFNQGALDTDVFSMRVDGGPLDVKSLVHSGETISSPMFSPDGHWILYKAAGRESEGIYVQPFPGPGVRQQITARGYSPTWRRDCREIVYLDRYDGKDYMWSVSVSSSGGGLRIAAPVPLFPIRLPAASLPDLTFIAVSSDGSSFYVPQAVEQPDSSMIHVAAGWMKR